MTDSHMIDGDGDGVDMSYGNVTITYFNGIQTLLNYLDPRVL